MSTPVSSLHQRLAREDFHRLFVEHVAVVIEHAVLAVARVRVERHVGQDA